MGPKMPVSLVCESQSDISSAIRNSLQATIINVPHTDIQSPTSDSESEPETDVQNQLLATAKCALTTKVDYEEISNHTNSVQENLKTKYVILKSTAAVTPTTNTSTETLASTATNGNGMSIANGIELDKSIYNIKKTIDGAPKQEKKSAEMPVPKVVLFARDKVQIGWESSDRRWQVGAGMINVGNTCYLNSTLQALFHVPSFANWLVSDTKHRENCEEKNGHQGGCIICAVAKTCLSSQQNTQAIRPYLVYSKLKMVCKHLVPGQQEDAHEFLRYLMEAMEKAYLARFSKSSQFDEFSKETTPINQILGGYLKTSVQCLACAHISVTYQHFEDLLLDIRKANSIDEALDLYFARERLEDMGYKCESCKKKVSATKQFLLERAPIALCIQLKRFSMYGNKLNKQISIRQQLNLSKYSTKKNHSEPLTYRLVSMVTHLGASQHCGHYTAIGITSGGGYYQFDDSSVRPISIQTVLNTNSYIMFYEMMNTSSNKLYQNSVYAENHTANGHTQMTYETIQNSNSVHGQNHYSTANSKPFIGPLMPTHLMNGNAPNSNSLGSFEPYKSMLNSVVTSTTTKPTTVTSTTMNNKLEDTTSDGTIGISKQTAGLKLSNGTPMSYAEKLKQDQHSTVNFNDKWTAIENFQRQQIENEKKISKNEESYSSCDKISNGYEPHHISERKDKNDERKNGDLTNSAEHNGNRNNNDEINGDDNDESLTNGIINNDNNRNNNCNRISNNNSNINTNNRNNNIASVNENSNNIDSNGNLMNGGDNGNGSCDNDTMQSELPILPSMPKLDFTAEALSAKERTFPLAQEKNSKNESVIQPLNIEATDSKSVSLTSSTLCNKNENKIDLIVISEATNNSIKSKLKYTPLVARQNYSSASVHPKSLVPYAMDEDSESDTAPEASPEVKTKAGTFQVTSNGNSESFPWLISNFMRKSKDNSNSENSNEPPHWPDVELKKLNDQIDDKKEDVPVKTENSLPLKRKTQNEDTTVASNKLLKLAHNGYGASVSSWTGTNSGLDNEIIEGKRDELKEQSLDFNDSEIDRGHKKKMKKVKLGRDNPGYNPFQEYSNMDAGRPFSHHIYRQNPHHYRFHRQSQPNNGGHYSYHNYRHFQRPHN